MTDAVSLQLSPLAQLVYSALKKGQCLTRMEAIAQLGVLDLPARILEIRKALAATGSDYLVESPKVRIGTRNYSRYALVLPKSLQG